MELLNPPVLVRASEWSDEPVQAHQWQKEILKIALHSLVEPAKQLVVLLPLPLLGLSQQLEKQRSERVKFEEASVKQVEAATEKKQKSQR